MKYPQLASKDWICNEVKTKSLREIAKEIGSSYGAVMHAVNKFGIRTFKKPGPKPGTDMRRIATAAYRKKYPNGRFGENAGNWRGGRRLSAKGYVYIYSPDHPHATDGGYVMEHRLMMEKKIGRYLAPGEIVHHKNGIHDDNREENLEFMPSRKEHAREHFDAVKEVDRLKAIMNRCKRCRTYAK